MILLVLAHLQKKLDSSPEFENIVLHLWVLILISLAASLSLAISSMYALSLHKFLQITSE